MDWPADLISRCLRGDTLLLYFFRKFGWNIQNCHERFTRSLPTIREAHRDIRESGTESLIAHGDVHRCQVDIQGSVTMRVGVADGMFPRGFTSIVIRGDIGSVRISPKSHAHIELLVIDDPFCLQFESDGIIPELDLITYMKALPFLPEGYLLSIKTEGGATCVYASQQLTSDPSCSAWKCEQFQKGKVLDVDGILVEHHFEGFHLVSSSLIICCESCSGRLMNSVVKTVKVTLLSPRDRVVWKGKIHGVFIQSGNVYRIDLNESIDLSRIDYLQLTIEFHESFKGRVHVFNRCVNVLHHMDGISLMGFVYC